MSGWQTVYLDTGDEAAARALAGELGSDLEAGEYTAGDENYSFTAYTPIEGHDDFGWSFAVLAQFNTDLPAGAAACTSVLASPYVRTPANPSNVWAS